MTSIAFPGASSCEVRLALSACILLGGATGNDDLSGGPQGDVLIGGGDADTLTGGKKKSPFEDSDLLIGCGTGYDELDAALQAILAEWASGIMYETRVGNLRDGSGVPAIDAEHLVGDDSADTLTGGPGQDWFVAGGEDTLKDRAANELADIGGNQQGSQSARIALALPTEGLPPRGKKPRS
jgi:Ca2+-binding RTX toxin-like protein